MSPSPMTEPAPVKEPDTKPAEPGTTPAPSVEPTPKA